MRNARKPTIQETIAAWRDAIGRAAARPQSLRDTVQVIELVLQHVDFLSCSEGTSQQGRNAVADAASRDSLPGKAFPRERERQSENPRLVHLLKRRTEQQDWRKQEMQRKRLEYESRKANCNGRKAREQRSRMTCCPKCRTYTNTNQGE